MNTDDKLHTLAVLFKARETAQEYFEDKKSVAEKFAAVDINEHYNLRIIAEIKKLAATFKAEQSHN